MPHDLHATITVIYIILAFWFATSLTLPTVVKTVLARIGTTSFFLGCATTHALLNADVQHSTLETLAAAIQIVGACLAIAMIWPYRIKLSHLHDR